MTSFRRVAVGVVLFSLTAHAALPPQLPAGDAADVKVGAVRASGTELSDLIDRLRDDTQRNIFVNWRALQAAGIPRELPVTIDLSGLTLYTAVDKLLKEVGGERVVLGHQVDEGVLTISTAGDLATNVETHTFDVRDLLAADDAGRAERLAAVVRRVQGIDPLSWKANGGKVGSVRELAGQLIVTHTPTVQRQIVAELRRSFAEHVPAAVAPAPPPADPSPRGMTKALLDHKIPEIRFDSVGLADVMSFVGDSSQVKVDAQWDELAKAGITRDSPVTLRLRNVPLRRTLATALDLVEDKNKTKGTGPTVMAVLDDGRLLVTTRQGLTERFTTDVRYALGDLLGNGDAATRKLVQADLRKLIMDAVASGTWSPAPEAPGGRATWDGETLVVRQTADAQADIAGVFENLRRQRK